MIQIFNSITKKNSNKITQTILHMLARAVTNEYYRTLKENSDTQKYSHNDSTITQ